MMGAMTGHAAAMTAKLAAAGRAVESRRPDRLFDDPLAAALVGGEGFRWMEEWRLPGMPEENPTIGPRTRFFDDLVVAAVAEGVRQVVLVAAGMDTRSFRLKLPAETVAYEVDQPMVLAEKQEVLDREHATPMCRRVPVVVDLGDDAWPSALVRSGFDTDAVTVFIAEGLSAYLTKDDNARLLDQLAALGPLGSTLGMDMLSEDYLDNPAVMPFLDRLRSFGIPWQFGTNDPADIFATHGWDLLLGSASSNPPCTAGHAPSSGRAAGAVLRPRRCRTFVLTASHTAVPRPVPSHRRWS
jgi:methyltransferase (TIGR00027 family)